MARKFEFDTRKFILAIVLIVVGFASIYTLNDTGLNIRGKDFTSIGLLICGLVFYSGFLVIVAMLKNETYLSTALLLPSIIAVAIFVYGFIGWSTRVSLSQWKGLLPDYTWAGISQYTYLFTDARFMIDVRNTAVFTVGFIAGCLILGLGMAILLDQKLKGEPIFRSIFLFRCRSLSLLQVWSGVG